MSNPPQNTQKFSLAATKERRDQQIQALVSKVQTSRQPSKSPLVDALITLGKEACSTSATIRNTALGKIMNIHKNNRNAPDYISPGSMWTFDSRFAVYWMAPVPVQIPCSTSDVMNIMQKLKPVNFAITSVGYAIAYSYSPKPTQPMRQVWTEYCIHGTPDFFRSLSQIKSLVFIPPQLPNMLGKLAKNLLKPLKPCSKERLRQVVDQSSCIMQDDINFFKLEDSKKGTTIINTMIAWVLMCSPHKATPGFPYNCMNKSGGFSWGSISESNTVLLDSIILVIERFFTRILALLKTKHSLTNPHEAFIHGRDLYKYLYSQTGMTYDTTIDTLKVEGNKQTLSLLPHIVWCLSSGNVKPVTLEDIKEGKPNRSIFMSPAMIRIAFMRLSQQASEHWTHTSKLKNFGWQNGGTDRLLNQLFSQVGVAKDEFWDHAEFIVTAKDTYDVTFPECAFFTPDIQSQDNHFDASFLSIFYDVVKRDFVKALPGRFQAPMACMLGFMNAMEEAPIILTNNNVFFYPKNLNPSGGPFTSQHSQNQSTVLGNEAKDFEWFERTKLAHVSSGDDAILMLYCTDTFQVSKEPINIGFRGMKLEDTLDDSKVGKYHKDHPYEVINAEIQKRTEVLQFGKKGSSLHGMQGFSAHIRKTYGIEFKPETLNVANTLSACEFLGASITCIPEQHYGIAALVASRPLHKCLFTILWPKQHITDGLSPQTTAAMRAFAVYYDIALVHKEAALIIYQVYQYFKKQAVAITAIPDPKYYESDFASVPTEVFLPDLPPLGVIFKWMTGLEPETRSIDSVEGGDYEGDYTEDNVDAETSEKQQMPRQKITDQYEDFETEDFNEEDLEKEEVEEIPISKNLEKLARKDALVYSPAVDSFTVEKDEQVDFQIKGKNVELKSKKALPILTESIEVEFVGNTKFPQFAPSILTSSLPSLPRLPLPPLPVVKETTSTTSTTTTMTVMPVASLSTDDFFAQFTHRRDDG
jgi:hypothetical protein